MNKNSKNIDKEIPEQVLELIPWYVMDSLSTDEKSFFESARKQYPQLDQHIKAEEELFSIISADQSLLSKSAIAPQSERLKAVFNVIDAEETSSSTQKSESSIDTIKSSFGSFVTNLFGSSNFGRAASTAALVVCLAALTAFVAPLFTDENKFTPASADDVTLTNLKAKKSSDTQTVLLIGYNGSSEELSKNTVLQTETVNIKKVPNREGVFQVNFEKHLSKEEIQQMIKDLQLQKELVWFAGESFESE